MTEFNVARETTTAYLRFKRGSETLALTFGASSIGLYDTTDGTWNHLIAKWNAD